ncbi:class I SAM-dependent methyltransferase [soil metagenome]
MDSSDVHKNAVQEQFGKTAQDYVISPTHASGQDIDRLVELTEATADDIALDVATGGGHTALAIAPEVRQVVASDLTPRMLDAARVHILEKGIGNARFELADAEDMPFGDASFDIVTCRIAPHHFGDIKAFASEVARVLKPGGRFVLMDSTSPDDDELDAFINELEQRRDPTHVRSYRLAEWIETLEAAGLVVDHYEPVVRAHEYESWTARSRMTPEDRAALDAWVLATPARVLDHFGVAIEDGKILRFVDYKALIRARK